MGTPDDGTPVRTSRGPERAGAVLLALILAAAVANLQLAANVALPSIGAAFDSTQTQLNLIAVGYSLGLAASVLYFGPLGDALPGADLLAGKPVLQSVDASSSWLGGIGVVVTALSAGGLVMRPPKKLVGKALTPGSCCSCTRSDSLAHSGSAEPVSASVLRRHRHDRSEPLTPYTRHQETVARRKATASRPKLPSEIA
jgi:hypothetical protein